MGRELHALHGLHLRLPDGGDRIHKRFQGKAQVLFDGGTGVIKDAGDYMLPERFIHGYITTLEGAY